MIDAKKAWEMSCDTVKTEMETVKAYLEKEWTNYIEADIEKVILDAATSGKTCAKYETTEICKNAFDKKAITASRIMNGEVERFIETKLMQLGYRAESYAVRGGANPMLNYISIAWNA